MRKLVSAVAIIIIAAAVAALVVFFQPSKKALEFEESDVVYFYLDENGGVSAEVSIQVPPSQFTNLLKSLITQIGTAQQERDYSEALRKSFARYGMEIENVSVNFSGFSANENLKITAAWRTPGVARWRDNKWVIRFGWADNESAAKSIWAEEEVSWTYYNGIALMYNYDFAVFDRNSWVAIILPQGAADVNATSLGETATTDYGGGSYGTYSLVLSQVGGRLAIVENGATVIRTEKEFTFTYRNLLENNIESVISYKGNRPENFSFLDSLEQVRLDIKYGLAAPENYSIFSGPQEYYLLPAQILYYSAKAVLENDASKFSLPPAAVTVGRPTSENGDWNAFWKSISKSEYLNLAQRILDNVQSTGNAPGSFDTSAGKIRYRDALYTLLRILSTYRDIGRLPDNILLAPVPSDNLQWGLTSIPASHAYYLLPETYVNTNTATVLEILDNIRDNHDNRRLAEEINNWTGSNLSYGLSFTTPTSEQVLTTNRRGQCRDYTNVYLAISRTAGLPARRMTGWVTSTWRPPAGWGFTSTTTPSGQTVALHAWDQVYVPGSGWIPLEPQSKRPELVFGTLPYAPYKEIEQTWMDGMAAYEAVGGGL
ncbi:MAG: transglutaminase-like domain-containing protein [Candidatus Hadarchaeota archaeon]